MYKQLVNVSKLKQLPSLTIPEPFKSAPENFSIEQLLEGNYWTQVVEKTTVLLTEYNTRDSIGLEDVPGILKIWHSRFYALLKLRLGSQVNDETLACLESLDHAEVKDLTEPVIWDLRLMLIPVRAKGINQTAIQQLYIMAAEARARIAGPDTAAWEDRLRKLGLHVAAALIGMRDPSTAIGHLENLHAGESAVNQEYAHSLARTLALIHIQMGNISEARRWLGSSLADEIGFLESFVVSDDFEKVPDNVNGSIAKSMAALHKGDIESARVYLEHHLTDLSLSGLYNLFVLYDLNPGTSPEKKAGAANAMVAAGRTYLGSYELFV